MLSDLAKERGVFEAIEKAYLDTLQVFITDSADNTTIRETYTYSFSYYGNVVSSVEHKEQQQYLCLSDAQRSLKAAIRCLLRAIKDLPRLPSMDPSLAKPLRLTIYRQALAWNEHRLQQQLPAGVRSSRFHRCSQK
jgi:hypothetical protein